VDYCLDQNKVDKLVIIAELAAQFNHPQHAGWIKSPLGKHLKESS
jgi:hypothetical protein